MFLSGFWDKGIVVEAWVRVAPAGIDLLTMATPVTATSIQTYLIYESGPTRLQIRTEPDPPVLSAPGCLHITARFVDILDLILDKGIVIDPLDRISLIGQGIADGQGAAKKHTVMVIGHSFNDRMVP